MRTRTQGAWLLLAALLVTLQSGIATGAPRSGSLAEPLGLSDLSGVPVDAEQLSGRTRVLMFGEIYHRGTREACVQIEQVLGDLRLAGEQITPVLIIAQDVGLEDLRRQAEALPFVGLVLHDPRRQAFGDYRIMVMPTVVVVDGSDRVVHSLPGMTARFSDILTDALLVATGRLSREQFQLTLQPEAAVEVSEAEARANRIAQLAEQLARRGLDEMAQEKYAEALALWPGHVQARLGLGHLFIKHRRIADAERQFRALLEADQAHTDAALGLAFVQALRGGEELVEAERVVREVLAREASQARAHYLLGLILEKRDRPDHAAESYRRAAEILLQRHGAE
jgi:tetratricopeptide (TPR) repeat protein